MINELDSDLEICEMCFGAGMEVVPGKGARTCQCRKNAYREKIIMQIPERNRRYGLPVLSELTFRVPDAHKNLKESEKAKIITWQKKIFTFAQKNPFHSLNLFGTGKIGKSQVAYALFLNAYDQGRKVRAFNLAGLLDDYAKAATQRFDNMSAEEAYRHQAKVRLTVQELQKQYVNENDEYTIVIDEFDKPVISLTNAQMRTIFEVLDAIKANRHQLICLGNTPQNVMKKALREKDMFIGDAIISRMQEEAVNDELFL